MQSNRISWREQAERICRPETQPHVGEISLTDSDQITDLDNRLHDVVVHREGGRPEAAVMWAAQAGLNIFCYIAILITKPEYNAWKRFLKISNLKVKMTNFPLGEQIFCKVVKHPTTSVAFSLLGDFQHLYYTRDRGKVLNKPSSKRLLFTYKIMHHQY